MVIVLTDRYAPIGVFDSGVGGISVLKSLVRELPGENFLYFGDSANAPYGTKSHDEIKALAHSAVERLVSAGAKAVVIACNTATAVAVESLREKYREEIPIIGIEPALKPAVLSGNHPRVAVMATPVTLKEEKFAELYRHFSDRGEVFMVPCPGLPEFVESGDFGSGQLIERLHCFLDGYIARGIDALVLGCTHYPFLKTAIRQVVGDGVLVFDGSDGTARETKRRLAEIGRLSDKTEGGKVVIENSDSGEKMTELSWLLFEREI